MVSVSNLCEVIEYKCPCCNAGLVFGGDTQQLTCEYCNNTFDVDTVKAFNLEERQNAEQARLCDEARAHAEKGYFLSGVVQPVMTLSNNIAYIAICIIGGYLAVNGSISDIMSPATNMSNLLCISINNWGKDMK